MKATSNIEAWQLLAALGDKQGFRGASLKLGLDLPACTRLMQRLELELGLQLVRRDVRPAQLTEAGAYMLKAARAVAEGHAQALQAAAQYGLSEYRIRLGVPVNNPRSSIFSAISAYAEKDPGMRVTVLSDLTHRDLFEGRAEAAYLPYRPPADGLFLWDIGRGFNALFATPGYLREHGEPRTPEDLRHHAVILRSGEFYPIADRLVRGGESVPLACGSVAFAGDVMSGREALLRGEGISVSLSFSSCWRELQEGLVVPVLMGWHRPAWQMTAAIARRDLGSQRLVNFMRWFVKEEALFLRARTRQHFAFLQLCGFKQEQSEVWV
ncbi:MAG: LysR family transcriptional regulator [Duodenibacillus sp.]|nr:LysR family transcriptional regulator [Duodenibacillus sp.]